MLNETTENIIIKFDGIINGKEITPSDIDITEIQNILYSLENFIFLNRKDKKDRPLISYKLESGSINHIFSAGLTTIIIFKGLIGEIASRNTIDFLEYKRAEIIENFQKIAIEKDINITFSTSLTDNKVLLINKNTKYFNTKPKNINTEMTLYGEIYQEGGIEPNLHIKTKKYGNLTVSATKEQIIEGEKRVYKVYGLNVAGKLNIGNGTLSELKLIDYINYNPIFDKNKLDNLIQKATINLSQIKDVDIWLENVREGELYE